MNMHDPIHILLVDDLPENLLSLGALLQKEGLNILKARSGTEALELLLKHEVALAILDVQMPEMDGFELAEHLRSIDLTRRVPLIFLTAGSFDRQRSFRGYEMGAVDFLHKPIEPDILRAKVEVFLELYRQRRELLYQRDELKKLAEENARLLDESKGYLQTLQEDDRRKDEFLATLAHELRNPLAPIGNGLQIIRMTSDKSKLADIRAMMERQVNHLVRLIDDLMDVSRIRQGKIVLRSEHVSVQNVLKNALETSTPFIEAGKHKVIKDIQTQDAWMHGDITRLAQIVSNLLNNAAKYTPAGGQITLSMRTEGEKAIIEVSDNGLGIPEHMLPKIFQLFTQVDRTLERSQGGLGIGLALVKQLVGMHGGSITATSQGQGKGSTFTVTLPLAAHDAVQVRQPQPSVHALPVRNLLKILIVDDNVPSAQSIGWNIEFMGHEYKLVHAGKEAIQMARTYNPDVILMDIGLPDMTGYDVCRTLRNEEQFKSTVMIAQTGWGQERDRRNAQEAGFNYHLTKPINFNELPGLLSKVTERV